MAALAAVISFLVMHAAIGAMIAVNGGTDALKEGAGAMVAGIQSLQMGVFGGILVGLGTAWLHNRYYRIELPQVLSFFGGKIRPHRERPVLCPRGNSHVLYLASRPGGDLRSRRLRAPLRVSWKHGFTGFMERA